MWEGARSKKNPKDTSGKALEVMAMNVQNGKLLEPLGKGVMLYYIFKACSGF